MIGYEINAVAILKNNFRRVLQYFSLRVCQVAFLGHTVHVSLINPSRIFILIALLLWCHNLHLLYYTLLVIILSGNYQ